jgi:HK97 family phage prohead protease
MEKEVRVFNLPDCELRASRRGRTIEGVGIVFDKLSEDLGGFREIIKPEAMNGVIERSDILWLLNHNEDKGALARSTNGKGTLSLSIEPRGVAYSFEAPDTVTGDEALSGIRRGDMRASSFAFRVAEGGEKWEEMPDKSYLRTITQFDKLYDLSGVYRPAYIDTSVATRSLVDVKTEKAEHLRIEAERIAAEEKKRADDLAEELRKSSEATNAVSDPVVNPPDLTEYFINLRKQIPRK